MIGKYTYVTVFSPFMKLIHFRYYSVFWV